MKLEKQCKTCEFNFNGVCAGHANTYKYGEEITDDTKTCEDWGASLDYFTYTTTNAPRFLREPFNDCQISYAQFSSLLDDYIAGNGISINIFDAIKFIYGISMVDIAVLMNVSYGVVYRAKTRGIPSKRIAQFSGVLGISPDLLIPTTRDFDKLQKARDAFWSRPDIDKRLNAMPEWKQELAHEISAFYFQCPIHLAQDFARVDRLCWTPQMPSDGVTKSEEKMIAYVTRSSKKHKPVIRLEYFLDIACKPHLRAETYNEEM